ncbi:hypothetical protein [Halomonas sp. Mc5H-6]|uniref:hypothetical protein n=1 Tax=Halomonas sp. Mc5H-6 TaxID=2954500 RepID=UPI00209761FB|nr:hypothetical protein [Halomonas sp. Mc5H-6]MCO7247215.1 hypothetical protein [Halomonas sp. Mc5H-6]
MSFKKIIDNHERDKEIERDEQERKVAACKEADAKFLSDFDEAVEGVAKPIFGRFVKDVQEAGYSAEMKEGVDGRGNPYLEVRFLPETVAKPNPSDYAVFVLKGDASAEKVEHNAYYDQRRGGDSGVERKSFGLPSIRPETVERHLESFLKKALESRNA